MLLAEFRDCSKIIWRFKDLDDEISLPKDFLVCAISVSINQFLGLALVNF